MSYVPLSERARRNPCAILLAVQLAGLLLYPFVERSAYGQTILNAFGILVLVLAVALVRRAPWLTGVSVLIAVPAIALLVMQALFDLPELAVWSAGLEALFYFHAAGGLIIYMLEDTRATSDELFAAGATFTLLAWGFTNVFIATQFLQPGAFAAAVNPESPRSWTELMYLSFALLSSTGIGDVVPITVHARALASAEMFTGVMYLATVVSRLIGLTLIQHRE
ncbi:MAG: two pore domain potassium channel family protein [Comamonadaceae bacterium]|nr:MAG: two pore domain potassium channel family protein [Comamonadaceae bacterium]